MKTSDQLNYAKVYQAIEYINANFKQQPTLDEIAQQVHLSPFHFQKVFSEWAGVSPKKYLQYLSLNYAKTKLRQSKLSLQATALDTGLSGSSRLHDLFINIEGMTPNEYKNGGANLTINYSFATTRFGKIIIASTTKGICFLSFCNDNDSGFEQLQQQFPKAIFNQQLDDIQLKALQFFQQDSQDLPQVKLHLKATEFQLKVWAALLNIPAGNLQSYGDVAAQVGNSKASRAVGTAIGNNPVAFLIPCHRVIQSTGQLGGYRWDQIRKQSMIGWEAASYDDPTLSDNAATTA